MQKNLFLSFYVFVSTFLSSWALAHLELESPIRVSSEVSAWNSAFYEELKTKKNLTECRETLEIPGTFLCQSSTQQIMNLALTRASFFVEGNNGKPGVVVPPNDPTLMRFLNWIGGHDLRAADLLRYYSAAVQACKADQTLCPHALEQELFEKFIVPYASANPHFIIITYAYASGMNWQDVVTHEILHAQYFSTPLYRQITDHFWDHSMTEEERSVVRSYLSRAYDTQNEFLMKNEFQAYMLMANADRSMLKSLVPKYRQPLLDELNKVGLAPIQVQ